MSTHVFRSEPVGGPVVTRAFKILGAFAALSSALIVFRFAAGLGASTAMNDGYPWGIWIAFDMVIGTALACGGYGVAILVYVLNRGKYHPLVRSAMLVSALGYTLGGVGVMLDLGRAWNTAKLPFVFWDWNLHSVLLEVALCVMLYTFVLWVEFSPALLERWRESRNERLRRFAVAFSPRLERMLPWLIALGLLLPTMHQSSLGSLMLLAGRKLHPLWQTPLLPLLFLVSCVAMGYAAIVIESALSSSVFKRRAEVSILASLAGPIQATIWLYVVLRVLDVLVRGRIGLVFDGWKGLLFLLELGLFVAGALLLRRKERLRDLGYLFRVSMLVAVAGALYRLSTFLIAYSPSAGWHYFPAVTELLITIGLVCGEVMLYVYLVKRFPVLTGARADSAR